MDPQSSASCAPAQRGWRLRTTIIVVLWLAAIFGGIAAMRGYEFTAGTDPRAPFRWPEASSIPRKACTPTLVVFAHPRCPCTKATLDQLASALEKAGASAGAKVVFFMPRGADAAWTGSAAIQRASAIPGVSVLMDEGGREARMFHAVTSGRTLLYSEKDELIFDGGITASRGHSGENQAATALVSLLRKSSTVHTTAPVFGCSILQTCAPFDSTSWSTSSHH